MIITDLHMHSAHSDDSEEPMENMIEEAVRRGLQEICFTEHYDMDFPKDKEEFTFDLDTDAYFSHFQTCKEQYKDRIRLLFGVEYGLQPHLKERCRDYIASYPFDFVIGSSHLANGKDPYLPEFFEGRSEKEAYLEYFESVLACVEAFDDFDVYGHLDYVVRYGPDQDRFYSYREYADILDEILKQIIQKGKGIEVNSGGLRHGLAQPNPGTEVLKRYRELGGEILTVGSDAHNVSQLAYSFDRTEEIIKEAGFRYITVFRQRKPEFLKL